MIWPLLSCTPTAERVNEFSNFLLSGFVGRELIGVPYSLKRWVALSQFLDDGQLPIDNNWIENQIRPIAIGRNNWLFAGSLRAGQRAAAVMSLIQSAKLNGHDPYAYLKDVLARLPTQKNSQIAELLPHRWHPLIT